MSAETVKEKRERRRKRRVASSDDTPTEAQSQGITEGKGRATPSRRTRTEEGGGNFLTRTVGTVREYFDGVSSEIQKVTWPTREETASLTRVVLVVTLASALFLGLVSAAFTELFNLGISRPAVFLAVFVVVIVAGLAYNRFWPRRAANL